ncbi:MAG: hypothetical protein V2A79_03520 [Planctomycetota bacterium]
MEKEETDANKGKDRAAQVTTRVPQNLHFYIFNFPFSIFHSWWPHEH